MISLDTRIDLLDKLAQYISSNDEQWLNTKRRAMDANGWFTQDNINLALDSITNNFLQRDLLEKWVANYSIKDEKKTIGIIMAGNIPLVGFHDFLCGFISGHNLLLKLSSKDEILLKHLIQVLIEWEPELTETIKTTELLKNCDAYIATGSNNSARYFEQYFGKYPNIIRKNRTSVALLDGAETKEDLLNLGNDIFNYFGLGCRNVTKLYIPEGYSIPNFLDAMTPFKDIINHHKYKNNYDYHLAIYLLNKVPYHSDDTLLMVENELPFSAVSVLHYEYYKDKKQLISSLQNDDRIQAIVGEGAIPFGQSQKPTLNDYADGVDTMLFLNDL
ncbi:MAG: acyl-CoA reductase [Flavipsychrobacter sp.]